MPLSAQSLNPNLSNSHEENPIKWSDPPDLALLTWNNIIFAAPMTHLSR